MSIAKEF
jgi:hypothetical protein